MAQGLERTLIIPNSMLEADLVIPQSSRAVIIFAHGSGSNRHSMRNRYVAQVLNDAGFATLLVDLLTPQEKQVDETAKRLRYDIVLLADRLLTITRWLTQEPDCKGLRVGYFASSTGAAAALMSASKLPGIVRAIVSRGGRPDLADVKNALPLVRIPILFIVGGKDSDVVTLNKTALKKCTGSQVRELAVIPGAGHLFEEPGKMEEVAKLASNWFRSFLLDDNMKFSNKYNRETSRFLSRLRDKYRIQLRFRNRVAAGEILALSLRKYENSKARDLGVIGIARGGIIVAAAVATKLGVDLDFVVPSRLRSPSNPEQGVGALMQDGSIYLNNQILESMEVSDQYIDAELIQQEKEIKRKLAIYRRDRREYCIKDRRIILVDDGAVTGATMIAAARWVRKQEPRELIIAIPVAPKHIVRTLRDEADQVEILRTPSNFTTVGQLYQDFEIVTDEQIINLLRNR